MLSWPSKWRAVLTTAIAIAAILPFAMLGPIRQDPAYHQFADDRPLFGIPNFADVTSNVPFLIAGVYGIVIVVRSARRGGGAHAAYMVFFVGVMLTCFGSAYYHWSPSNARLMWDRLPMTLGFMGLLAATISERVDDRLGKVTLLPLAVIGVFSVLLWSYTESLGRGDLRLYVCVQFVSLILIVIMIALFRSDYDRSWELLLAIGLYAGAKIVEVQDRPIFQNLGLSGHTLKHVLAAIAVIFIADMVSARRRRELPAVRVPA